MIAQGLSKISEGLGSLVNLVPTPGKLTIIPVKQFSPVPKPTGHPPYVAMFNPEQWQLQESVSHNTERPIGGEANRARYNGRNRNKLAFDLTVDGTGASGEKREVLADIAALKTIIGFNGDEHRTNRLLIIWGSQVFSGVNESISVKYTLFRADGTPLRAVVSLSFIEDKEPFTALKKLNLMSSDLTHRRLVTDNARLDLMCYYIYDDTPFHVNVAEVNDLTSLRELPVGKELIFPPTEK